MAAGDTPAQERSALQSGLVGTHVTWITVGVAMLRAAGAALLR